MIRMRVDIRREYFWRCETEKHETCRQAQSAIDCEVSRTTWIALNRNEISIGKQKQGNNDDG